MNSIPANLWNPFTGHIVENTWIPPVADVPALHQKAFEKFVLAHAQVRQTSASTSLLVQGSAGSGKTHLVARIRQHLLATEKSSLLVWIRLSCTADTIWRFLRKVLAEELLRPDSDVGNPLQRLLQARFPGWAPIPQDSSIFSGLFGKASAVGLADLLAQFDETCPLHSGLLKVLPVLFDPAKKPEHKLARAWLRGNPLGEEDLKQLKLAVVDTTERDDEVEAKEIVLGLCRLAGTKTTLCICFDQVEGLQLGARDFPTLAAFARAATDMVADPHSALLVITFCRSDICSDIKAAASDAVWQRLSANSSIIPPLTWEQAFRLYVKRLESDVAVQQARAAQTDPYWPLGEEFLRRTWEKDRFGLTPRHLLIACREEFERLQGPVPEPPSPPPPPPPRPSQQQDLPRAHAPVPPPPPPGPLAVWLEGMWHRHRQDAAKSLDKIDFPLVLTQGLSFLVEALKSPLVLHRPIPPQYVDLSMVFGASNSKRAFPSLGISLCDHNPHRLPPRIKRLRKQWETARTAKYLGELAVIRPARSHAGPKGNELLDSFNANPARVIRIEDQQLAELAALQRLFQDAHNGNLTRNGPPIPVQQVSDWAAENTPSSLRALLHTVFGDHVFEKRVVAERTPAHVS